MKSDTLKHPQSFYPRTLPTAGLPAARPAVHAPARPASRLAYASLVARHVLFTILFVFYCIGAAVAAWYFVTRTGNVSYELVDCFITAVATANVVSKYVVWCVTH
ncbi:MAG TPA: hypothetical protein VMT99_00075 [Candidatus Paceibacterota bacterium]|nr:hypothetical protein [Candidatus Paceibacterota bacterium]